MVVIAKAVTYLTTLSAAGAVLFLAYSRFCLLAATDARIRSSIIRMSGVAALASGAKILFTAGSLGGEPAALLDSGLVRMVLQTGEGWSLAIRLIGLSCICWGIHSRRQLPALAGAGAAATSFACVGHVHALPFPVVPAALLSLHLSCVAFWLGALRPLYFVTGEADVAGMAPVVSRFGATAVPVVGVLLLAGAGLLIELLNGVTDLWSSDYGRLALVKIGLVAGLLSVAAFNKLRLTPRLRAGDRRAAAALRTRVAVEIVLAWAIAVVTAALTTLGGPAR